MFENLSCAAVPNEQSWALDTTQKIKPKPAAALQEKRIQHQLEEFHQTHQESLMQECLRPEFVLKHLVNPHSVGTAATTNLNKPDMVFVEFLCKRNTLTAEISFGRQLSRLGIGFCRQCRIRTKPPRCRHIRSKRLHRLLIHCYHEGGTNHPKMGTSEMHSIRRQRNIYVSGT